MRGLAALVVLLAAATAAAEPVGDLGLARRHIDGLALDLARAELETALAGGDNDRARLAEIYLLLGVVDAGLDRPEQAREHFRRLLALDPRASVPIDLGPKILGPFSRASDSLRGLDPLALRAEPTAGALTVAIASDPAAMIDRIAVRFDRGPPRVVMPPRQAIAPPAGAVRATLVALDQHGNRVAELAVDLARARPAAAAEAARRSWLLRWPLWAGVGVGFAALGGGFALEARATERELDDLQAASPPGSYTRAEELDRHGRRATLVANLAFGAAGAAAIAAAILWLDRPPAAEIALAPSGGGGVLAIGGRF